MIADPCHTPDSFSIFAGTIEPKYTPFQLVRKGEDGNKTMYTVNIIDTPGLFEVFSMASEMKSRTDEEIMKMVQTCLNNDVTKLNALVLFATADDGMNPSHIKSIELYLNYLKCSGLVEEDDEDVENAMEVGMKKYLCITRADNFSDAKKEKIRSEIMSYPGLSEILKEFDVKGKSAGYLVKKKCVF